MAKRQAFGGGDTTTRPRPRKKQAVTKTHSAATKALIVKNAKESPLLRLPAEVREKVLVNLVGGNLIHIKFLSTYELAEAKDFNANGPDKDSPLGAFRHAICVAPQSEQHVYDDTVSGSTILPADESLELHVATFNERHVGCKMCGEEPIEMLSAEEKGTLKVDLRVLGACRQLYEEANHLLWATNTFSFGDANSFNKFMASLNPAQKRNMSTIQISASIDHYVPYGHSLWSTALKMSYIHMLRGVQNLHLSFQQQHNTLPQISSPMTYTEGYMKAKEAMDRDMQPFLRLRALNAKNTTVILSDHSDRLTRMKNTHLRWTVADKNLYAEVIRAQIVDPKGADRVKEEAEAASVSNKLAIKETAERRLKNIRLYVRIWRAKFVEYTEDAELQEAKAARTQAKADRFPEKKSEAWRELQADAETQAQLVKTFRLSASQMAGIVKSGETEAVEKAVKFERAKARLEGRKFKTAEKAGDIDGATDETTRIDRGKYWEAMELAKRKYPFIAARYRDNGVESDDGDEDTDYEAQADAWDDYEIEINLSRRI